MRRGFTLIELMVVLTIIGIVSVIVITSQSAFNKTLVLANTAYDIALTVRSAETFGLGSRATTFARNTGYTFARNTGYGVDFQRASPKSFILFADALPLVGASPGTLCHTPPANDPSGPDAKPGNCVYDADLNEKVTSYTLGNSIILSDFCAYNSSTSLWECATSHGNTVSSLDIVFTRPNPEPSISVNGTYSASYTAACLSLTSNQGVTYRYVSIAASGEITANALQCPTS